LNNMENIFLNQVYRLPIIGDLIKGILGRDDLVGLLIIIILVPVILNKFLRDYLEINLFKET